jgi:hypothetical protein
VTRVREEEYTAQSRDIDVAMPVTAKRYRRSKGSHTAKRVCVNLVDRRGLYQEVVNNCDWCIFKLLTDVA